MSCRHRFYDKLIPDWPIKYLFVGTFNPEWDGKNNAKYFYGRQQNRFWEIMPMALALSSQIQNREHPELLENFLRENAIGLTDLIIELKEADKNNPEHRRKILSFSDNELIYFKPIFNEKIFNLIDKNSENLRYGGVFLTRRTLPPKNIGCFWHIIESFCYKYGIPYGRLLSPSQRVGRISFINKIKIWKYTFDNAK